MTTSVGGVRMVGPAVPEGEPGAAPAPPDVPAFGPLLLLLLLGIGEPASRPEGPAHSDADALRDQADGDATDRSSAAPAPAASPILAAALTPARPAAPAPRTERPAATPAASAGEAPAETVIPEPPAPASAAAQPPHAPPAVAGSRHPAPAGESAPVEPIPPLGGERTAPTAAEPAREDLPAEPAGRPPLADPTAPSGHTPAERVQAPPPDPSRPAPQDGPPRIASPVVSQPIVVTSPRGAGARDGLAARGERRLWPASDRAGDAVPAGDRAATFAVGAVRPQAGAPELPAVGGPAAVEAPPQPEVPLGEQVVRAARLVVTDRLARLDVELEPPELGAIRITADQGDGGLGLRIVAERAATQTLLVQALPEIHARLAAQGMGAATLVVAPPPSPERPGGRREGWRPRHPAPHADPPPRPRAAEPAESIDFVV